MPGRPGIASADYDDPEAPLQTTSELLWHHAGVIRGASLLCAVALLLAAPAAGIPASIRIVGSAPVKVVGRGFPGNAKVRVTLFSVGTKKTRAVFSTRAGRFTVTFDAAGDRCAGYTVTAVGGGTTASAKVAPHECPSPLTPP
jgi:hypothetical protein